MGSNNTWKNNQQRKKITKIKIQKTRKELRKEHRKQIKAKRKAFFERKHHIESNSHVIKNGAQVIKTNLHERKKDGNVMEEQLKFQAAEKQRMQRLEKQMKKQRVKHLKKANEMEDRAIKKLEKNLKLNKHKRKSIPKTFVNDGLNYILEVCSSDRLKSSAVVDATFNDCSDFEFEKDITVITGETKKNNKLFIKDVESENDKESELHTGNSNEVEDKYNWDIEDYEESGSNEEMEKYNCLEDESSQNDNKENGAASTSNGWKVCKNKSQKSKVVKMNFLEKEPTPLSPIKKGLKYKRKHHVDEENEILVKSKKKQNLSKIYEPESKVKNLVTFNEIVKSKGQRDKNLILENSSVSEMILKENENSACCDQATVNKNWSPVKMNIENTKLELCEGRAHSAQGNGKRKKEENDVEEEKLCEDIHGKICNKQENIVQVVGKYVPPYLRSDSNKKPQDLQRLKKQLKGLLNRLAESNMKSIAVQLEEFYMSHSRNDMNTTLTNLLMESLVAPVLTPERLIMEHAMLIAILHGNVGTEIGAHILQVVVKMFHALSKEHQQIENKEIDNIIILICHLYNFKVLDVILIYGILAKLVEEFGEKEVELILLILKSIGFSLRKDDPVALKNFILTIQAKANEAAELRNNSRVKFMLDVLLAIKNNNISKIPNYDPSHVEHLKKCLKGLLHQGSYITQLKISLQDLLSADVQGRWWIVGSAWTGSTLGNEGKQKQHIRNFGTNYSAELLELSRKQRMNTDLRRNIFCILMTAEDYLDAFERLLHLGLRNQQQQEIIHVVIHCCLQEKKFNIYYAQIAQKFCDLDRKYQMSIQCSIWDKLKELKNITNIQITNLSKFLVHLVTNKCLPLSVLKVFEFTELTKVDVRFLRQVLLGIMLHSSESNLSEIFQSQSLSPKLCLFRQGLRIFLHNFLQRNMEPLLKNTEMLQQRINIVDKILRAADSKSKFQM